jgi:hypothetical protein
MKPRIIWIIALIATPILICLLFCVLFLAGTFVSTYVVAQARSILGIFNQIQVGVTTQAEARALLKPVAAFGIQTPTEDQLTVRSRLFNLFGIGPSRTVSATLDYSNGVVSSKSMQFSDGLLRNEFIQEALKQSFPPESTSDRSWKDRYFQPGNPRSSGDFSATLRDTTDVPLERRKLDWQINFSCMATIGHCRDPRVFLVGGFMPLHSSNLVPMPKLVPMPAPAQAPTPIPTPNH